MPDEKTQPALRSLLSVPAGQQVRVVRIDGGRAMRSRLAAMGLVRGAEVEVVRNSGHGPFIVSVKGSRIILGKGMASRVYVE